MRTVTVVSFVLALGLATVAAAEPSSQLSTGAVVPAEPAKPPASADDARKSGVKWILANQRADGGWSSGTRGTDGSQAASDVATTALSVLALVRDAEGGPAHRDAIRKGVLRVVAAVETAPQGPRLDTPQGTQIQYKLGQLVDTHFAALMLGEVAGSFDPETNARVDRALEVVVVKVQQAQNGDGSFDGNGWAPVLSSSIAAQSLNQAVALGKDVDDAVLARSDQYQAAIANTGGEGFDASAGAGVELYAVASTLRNATQTTSRSGDAAAAPSQVAAAEQAQRKAEARVSSDDGRLLAGFGSIGGEEMLSYMMISDTLAEQGGKEWKAWEERVGAYLAGTQNADGSWVGHHCITSRAFTTAGAVMTLTAGVHAATERTRG